MGTSTRTATVNLVPTGSTGATNFSASSSYPASNGYHAYNDSNGYARFTVTQSATGYIYYTFDASEIPSNATITSITATAHAYVNNTTRVTNTTAQLYTNTTAKGSSASFGTTTSSNTFTITPGSWTRSELTNLRLRIGATGSSSSSSRYVYFYGCTVAVTYSYTVTTYDVTISNSTSTTVTASETEPVAGTDVVITAESLSGLTITDNNTDVTSQFTEFRDANIEAYPSNSTYSSFTPANIDNAYHSADNTTYAQLSLAGSTTGTIDFTFGDLGIPSGATITEVSCSVTLQFNNNSSSSGFTSSTQMYAGSTAKGSATQWVSSGSAVAKNTYNLTVGSWTASELANAKLHITATNSASRTARYIYVYGATLTVTYESASVVYVYTISNIAADHTIVVSGSTPVVVHVTGVSVSPTTASIAVGATTTLTETVAPSTATDKSVSWSTSNASVATVSGGVVTGVAAGSATITVTTTDGSYTATCAVTVTGGSTETLYYKVNGAWTAVTEVYKKVNGTWVQQTNLEDLFDSSIRYIYSGGGTTWTTVFEDTIGVYSQPEVNQYNWVSPYTTPFEAGQTYRVTWGSNTYICQTQVYSDSSCEDGYAIGDATLLTVEGGSGTEPFFIFRTTYSSDTLLGITSSPAGSVYIKIELAT